MDKTGENTQAATPSGSDQNPQIKIKFDNSFTPEVDAYIDNCELTSTHPTVQGFADFIGTDEESVIAWANKRRKDEKGNLTEQLARPNFNAAIGRLIAFQEEEKKQEEEVIPVVEPEVKEEVQPEPEKKQEEIKTTVEIRQELRDEKLNKQQERFCQLYATDREFFGNGVQTYIEVYKPNQKKANWYQNACSAASQILSNTKVITRINEILEARGLNDAFVDKQLEFLITQHADFSNKLGAIKEYNKLKERITDKMDHTTKGEKIAQVVGLTYVQPDKPDVTDNASDQADL